MTLHENKLLTIVAAAALALAVGACSSSSSDDEEIAAMTPPATTDPAPEPTPAPTAAEQLTAANAAVTAANAMVAALTSSSTAEDAAAAYAALGAAQTALHAASSLRENQIAAKQAEINDLQTQLNDLQTQVAQLQMTIEEAARVAAEAARVAMEVAPVEAALVAATAMVDGLTTASTETEVTAARDAIMAAQTALDGAMDLPQDVSDDLGTQISSLDTQVTEVNQQILDIAEAARVAAEVARVAMEVAPVEAAIVAATAMVDGLTDASTQDEVTAARDAVMAAQTALAEAMDLPQVDSDGLDTRISGLDTQLSGIETMVENRLAQEAIEAAALVAEAEMAAAAALIVAKTAEAGTKAEALTAEAEQTTVAGLGGSGVDTVTMDITRPRSGTVVKITDTALPEDDDPMFALYKDLGEGRTMHTRKMEADEDGNVVEEVVIVSTDIAAPKATPFAMVEGQALRVNPKTNDEDDFRSITVAAGTDGVNLPKIMSAAFTAGTKAELTFDSNDTATDDEDEAFETVGTYNGAMGTYRCDGTAECTVNIDDGKISGIGEGWVFTPNKGVTSDVPDADYLNYGFWLKKTTDEDGVLTYNEVETFAGSSLGASNVSAVEGSATYNGGATGVYVKNVHKSDGTLDTATAGHFTADANLKAHFGGESVAVVLHDTITGTIDNFALSGEEENAWSVALKSDMFTADNGTASGTANGGGAEGAFSATFHGSTAAYDHDDNIDTPEIRRQPSSVVGEFDANFSNGSVAGGFGARN